MAPFAHAQDRREDGEIVATAVLAAAERLDISGEVLAKILGVDSLAHLVLRRHRVPWWSGRSERRIDGFDFQRGVFFIAPGSKAAGVCCADRRHLGKWRVDKDQHRRRQSQSVGEQVLRLAQRTAHAGLGIRARRK